MTHPVGSSRTIRAAILESAGAPLAIVDLQLEGPHSGEVMVRMVAVGVCHSDVSVFDQTLPSKYPIVLGHEGSGVVEAVGEGVDDIAPGDRVVLSWLSQCGHCFYCTRGEPALCEVGGAGMSNSSLPDGTTRLRLQGEPVAHMLGLGAFADYCVVPANSVHRLPDDIPFTTGALIGCGVLTGFGAAVNTAKIRAGDSVAVIGCGGVGLNAIQGAVISGAAIVVAIDPSESRRALALEFGATHVMAPDDDTPATIRALTEGRGVDVAIESAGREDSIKLAVRITRPGGQSILVGGASPQVRLSVPVFAGIVTTEKMIRGSLYGSSDVARDIARVVGHYQAGEMKLDELVTETFTFDEVEKAFAYCAEARGARAVVVMDPTSL